jgi:hypothetical protein
LEEMMLVTKHHSIELGRGTAVLMSDPGLGEQYIHSDYGHAANAGIDCAADEVSMSVMLMTRDTSFRVQLHQGSSPEVLQLNKGDVILFKGDLRHSGGENASLEANMRFFAYLPHRKQVPMWIHHKHNAKACVYSTGQKVLSPKKISKATVDGENLPYVTMPTSPLFVMQKYQECLFCSNTRTFYKFEADAFFAGVQTNEPTDAKDYGVPATFLVRKGCNHFPDHGRNYTWKDAHSWLIKMRKYCNICHRTARTKRARCSSFDTCRDNLLKTLSCFIASFDSSSTLTATGLYDAAKHFESQLKDFESFNP